MVASTWGPGGDTKSSSGTYFINYIAATSACEKCGQWQQALALLAEARKVKWVPSVISYNSAISACEKCEQ